MIDNDVPQMFIQKLASVIRKGYRVIPLIGSGASVAAGIPVVQKLRDRNLLYWILRALGLNPWADVKWIKCAKNAEWDDSLALRVWEGLSESRLPMWCPRLGDWPELSQEYWLLSKHDDKLPQFDSNHAIRILRFLAEAAVRLHKRVPIAISVLAELEKLVPAKHFTPDWRQMIEFLSRLEWSCNQRGAWRVGFGSTDTGVADSLFQYFCRNRQPTLCHEMLASLAPLWRGSVVLTTNFDTLIEDAFERAGQRLEVFEVPRGVSLPHCEGVLAHASLVKLNGGRHGLRADASIDEPVDNHDAEMFLSYLVGRQVPSLYERAGAMLDDKVAILTIGVSGEDRRTVSLLERAKDEINNLEIFWATRKNKPKGVITKLITASVQRPNQGLILLDLYQELTRSVPTVGAVFPTLWHLPMPPLIPAPDVNDDTYKNFTKAKTQLKRAINTVIVGRHKALRDKRVNIHMVGQTPLAVLLRADDFGGNKICVECFSDTEWQGDCQVAPVWLDLEEVAAPVGVLLRLILMAANRSGEPDPISTLDTSALHGDEAKQDVLEETVKAALTQSYASSGDMLLVFLNAQYNPGKYALYSLPSTFTPGETPVEGTWRDARAVEKLLDIIETLNQDAACGIQFIWNVRSHKDVGGLDTRLRRRVLRKSWRKLELSKGSSEYKPAEVVTTAIRWLKNEQGNQPLAVALLYLIATFRNVRYRAGLLRILTEYQEECDLTYVRNEQTGLIEATAMWLTKSLAELERVAIIRFKDGGFVWMNHKVAEGLRTRLELHWPSPPHARSITCGDCEAGMNALTLGSLAARWHGRLLLATADPLAAVEGVYHALEGMRPLLANTVQNHCPQECLGRISVVLRHARLLLRTAQGLFIRRLSSQFAAASLEKLQELIDARVKEVNDSKTIEQTKKQLRAALIHLQTEIVHLHTIVALREADFTRAYKLARNYRKRCLTSDFNEIAKPNGVWLWPQEFALCLAAAKLHQRDYKTASGLFKSLLDDVCRGCKGNIRDRIAALLENTRTSCLPGECRMLAREWLSVMIRPENNDSIIRFLVRIARSWLYLHLNRSQLVFLYCKVCARKRAGDAARERKQALEAALRCYHFALELLRAMPNTEDGFVFEENVRLRCDGSLCQGLLETQGGGGHGNLVNTPRASVMVSDAEAFITDFPIREGGVNNAVVALRRAELPLTQFNRIEWFSQFRKRMRNARLEFCHEKEAGSDLKELWSKLSMDYRECSYPYDQRIADIVVPMLDAESDFERAKQHLCRHPKSRWWWWIYCVLRMKNYEYLYSARVASVLHCRNTGNIDREEQCPQMPRSCPRFIDYELVELIHAKDIRDLFYLSRIMFSYACTIKMQIALALLKAPIDLLHTSPLELRDARNFLEQRVKNLGELIDTGRRLHMVDTRGCSKDKKMAEKYYCECRKEAERVRKMFDKQVSEIGTCVQKG